MRLLDGSLIQVQNSLFAKVNAFEKNLSSLSETFFTNGL